MLTITLSILLACSTEKNTQSTEKPATKIVSPTKKVPLPQVDLKKPIQLGDPDARTAALAPSPRETRLAAEKAGVTTQLQKLIPERHFSLDIKDKNHAAVRTGIILSDTVLLIEELPKDALLSNMQTMETGLKQIGAGTGLLDTLSALRVQVDNDAITRKELLDEMESIVELSVPEKGFGKDDTTGPLLQAGAWLSSINLLGKALLQDNKVDQADKLLRHAHVASYFLLYADVKGENKLPSKMMEQLKEALYFMQKLAEKKEITKEDIEKLVSETDQLLTII